MRTMEIYMYYVSVCFVFLHIWFILMQHSHRFSISCDIGYKSAFFFFYILSKGFFFFFLTFIEGIFPLISLTFCHESWPWSSVHSPPEVTPLSHWLSHHTDSYISPKDYISHNPLHWRHTADFTDHSSHTLYKPWTCSLWLPSIV